MELVFDELLRVNIAEFMKGIRHECGETLVSEDRYTEELTQNIWYVWSPVGCGETEDEKTRAYYGKRAGCISCSMFSKDLLTASYVDLATQCSRCSCKNPMLENYHVYNT